MTPALALVLLFIPPQAGAEPLACRVYSCMYLCPPSSSPDRPLSGVGVFLPKAIRRCASPASAHLWRAILGPFCQVQPGLIGTSKRQKPNPVTEPESGATEHSQIGAEAELIELRAWRDALLQPTQTAGAIFSMQKPGDKRFCWRKRSGWKATMIRWCVCARPTARHYACPAHADLPQPLPGRVGRLPF